MLAGTHQGLGIAMGPFVARGHYSQSEKRRFLGQKLSLVTACDAFSEAWSAQGLASRLLCISSSGSPRLNSHLKSRGLEESSDGLYGVPEQELAVRRARPQAAVNESRTALCIRSAALRPRRVFIERHQSPARKSSVRNSTKIHLVYGLNAVQRGIAFAIF